MDIDRTKHTTVQDEIDDVYKTAFKARDKKVYLALRTVLSVIKQASIDQRKELSNEEIVAILKTEVKKRKEAMAQFKEGGRADLVEQAENEIEQISKFLPPEMPDDELEKIVKEVLEATGASGPGDIGKAMGAVMGKIKGQADGGRVRDMVQKLLG